MGATNRRPTSGFFILSLDQTPTAILFINRTGLWVKCAGFHVRIPPWNFKLFRTGVRAQLSGPIRRPLCRPSQLKRSRGRKFFRALPTCSTIKRAVKWVCAKFKSVPRTSHVYGRDLSSTVLVNRFTYLRK